VFAEVITALSRAVYPELDRPPATLAAHLRALERREGFIRAWEEFLADWDALICPTAMCTAFPHCESGAPLAVDGIEEPYWTLLDHCCRFNLTGHPAAVIPVGLDRAGLPIGVQVVGRRWGDARLLAVVKALATATDGFRPPPGY
jgi:amidase